MYSSDTKIRVRYGETDQMGVVYHANYFGYFEAARTESIRQFGLTYKEMEQSGTAMPIVEVHATFLRSALYDDLLTVKTILKELPTDHKIEFHHEVYNEKNKLLATGRVVLYFIDAASMKKVTIPDTLLKKLEPYFSQNG